MQPSPSNSSIVSNANGYAYFNGSATNISEFGSPQQHPVQQQHIQQYSTTPSSVIYPQQQQQVFYTNQQLNLNMQSSSQAPSPNRHFIVPTSSPSGAAHQFTVPYSSPNISGIMSQQHRPMLSQAQQQNMTSSGSSGSGNLNFLRTPLQHHQQMSMLQSHLQQQSGGGVGGQQQQQGSPMILQQIRMPQQSSQQPGVYLYQQQPQHQLQGSTLQRLLVPAPGHQQQQQAFVNVSRSQPILNTGMPQHQNAMMTSQHQLANNVTNSSNNSNTLSSSTPSPAAPSSTGSAAGGSQQLASAVPVFAQSQQSVAAEVEDYSSAPILSKQRLEDLVREVDPFEQLDDDVKDALLQYADDFIESVASSACQLAKHRNSNVLESKDVLLTLERNWNMWIPGYGVDEVKPPKKVCVADAHKQRTALIKKTLRKI